MVKLLAERINNNNNNNNNKNEKETYASLCGAVRNKHISEVTGQSRDRPLTFKQNLFDFPTKSEVTRPSADCQKTVFRGIKQLEEFLKKVAERSRDSGRRSRDRRPTVKQRFLDVSNDLKLFSKKSLNGHATVVGGHATVGRLSNNCFPRYQAIGRIFEKSR